MKLTSTGGPYVSRPLRTPGVPDTLVDHVDPAVVKQLALAAVDAARTVGASYADVKLTRQLSQTVDSQWGQETAYFSGWGSATDEELLYVRVRALVNGYWGVAESPYWRSEEMPVLARQAVSLAKASAKGPPRVVDWRPIPIAQGDWIMPVELDPFTVPLEEKMDLFGGLSSAIGRWRVTGWRLGGDLNVYLWRQERTVATTEGAYFTQTVYRTHFTGGVGLMQEDEDLHLGLDFKGLRPEGGGWEVVRNAKLLDQLPALEAELEMMARVPREDLDPGRYDVITAGPATPLLLQDTLGRATELDRATGDLANTTGSSFLGPDPLAFLGTFQLASPIVTVTATRALQRQVSTVKWDDEGVEPEPTTLVTDGVLTDYQTTREQAGWLAPYYEKHGKPVRSHGFAGYREEHDEATAYDGRAVFGVPTLDLAPGATPVPLADMIAGTKKGLLLGYTSRARLDFQCKTGSFMGNFQRIIRNGKVGPFVGGSALFDNVELWKSVKAVGPAAEVTTVDEGQAPPVLFTNVTVVR